MSEFEFKDSIYFGDDHRMIRDQLRRFIAKEVMPNGDDWENNGMVPRETLKKLGDLGIFGMRHDEAYGGAGMDVLSSIVLSEELGRSSYGGFSATILVHTDMASPHLARAGSAEQKEKYLPQIISGEKITAIAVTEPGGGSDVAALRTKAVLDGNEWVLNGSKTFITNGVHGDIVFVAARTDADAKASRGISMFIVEKGTPGFSISRSLDKHGWRSSDTAELVFEDCRIPAGNLLGEENKGFYSIMSNFQNERMVLAGMAIGESAKAIELTLDWVKNRQAFGGTLWDKQTIRHRIAMHTAKLEASRQLLHYCAWLESKGEDCVREVSQVKSFACEMQQELMYDCVQFHGGMGYMRESPIERMSRDARILTIGGGTTETMLEEVAKRL
jgi:acyl-CoA dehydrogenase